MCDRVIERKRGERVPLGRRERKNERGDRESVRERELMRERLREN